MQTKYIPDPVKFPAFRVAATKGIIAPSDGEMLLAKQVMGALETFHKNNTLAFWSIGHGDDLLPADSPWNLDDVGLDRIPSVPPFPVTWSEFWGRSDDGAIWRHAILWLGTKEDDGFKYSAYVMSLSPTQDMRVHPFRYTVWFDADGVFAKMGLQQTVQHPNIDETFKAGIDRNLLVSLVSFMFSHCKNVDTVERLPSRQTQRAVKRSGFQILKHHEVAIKQSHTVTRGVSGGNRSDHPKKSLHVARGSFATYTEDAPLFGKYVGTFWRPAHVRGSAEAGTVYKDYKVKP